jgi:hypothetical protein
MASSMWPRLILRELIPMLPRLLRLLPVVEGFFFAERSAQSADGAETTHQLIADLQEQIRVDVAERRHLILDLQARLEGSQQDLQMMLAQLTALEQQVRQLTQQMRLLVICGIGISVAALASVIMVAVRLAHSSH